MDFLEFIRFIPSVCRTSSSYSATNYSCIEQGTVFALGNPLLDMITLQPNTVLLKKYDLAPNSAILAKPNHLPLFKEVAGMKNTVLIPGGAGLNTLRVFQWMVNKPYSASFAGAIGNDTFGDLLTKRALSDGVRISYQVRKDAPTGTCAVIVTDQNRALVANLGAATLFTEDWLNDDQNMQLVRQANYFYTTGFFVAVNPLIVHRVANMFNRDPKIFILNLSAPYVMETHKEFMAMLMTYADVIIGNKEEALKYAEVHNWPMTDIETIGCRIQSMSKPQKRPRIVIITDSEFPVLCFQQNEEIVEFAVPKVHPKDIGDTNGCGDAFVGGFLAQLVKNMPISYCICSGVFAAQQVLRVVGCQIEKLPKLKVNQIE